MSTHERRGTRGLAAARLTLLAVGAWAANRATTDPGTGAMRDAFIPNSTDGGSGDHLHPNRPGYAAIAGAVALDALMTP